MYLTCAPCFCADNVSHRRLLDRMVEHTCIAVSFPPQHGHLT